MKHKHYRSFALLVVTLCFIFIGITSVQASSAVLNNNTSQQVMVEAKQINTDKASPQVINSEINITTEASGNNLLYRFWIHDGISWKVVQGYSSKNSFKWTPNRVGTHRIWVDVKASNSSKDVDSYKEITYNIVDSPKIKALYTNMSYPQPLGSTIKITAEGTGGLDPLYRFWIKDYTGWKIVKDYSRENFYNWTPVNTGDHSIWVDIKDSSSKNSYDSYKEIYYYIGPGIKGINTDKPTPQVVNSSINITADAGGGNLLYRFWIHDGASWKVVKPYSTSNSYSWKPTKVGSHRIWVDIKAPNSPRDVDSYKEITYEVRNYPVIKGIITSLPSPQSAGSNITITGDGSGGVNPLYRFWVKDSSGWKVVRDYAPEKTFNWVPEAAGNYILWIDIKDKNSPNSYYDYKEMNYTVNPAKVIIKTDKLSPQTINSQINITASYAAPNTLYRFWVYDGANWKVVKDYSKDNSYLWTPTKIGTYRLWVDVKSINSTKDYDTYHEIYYDIKNESIKKTIVIDPGHNYGGDDGAYGYHGDKVYSERDLNMQIATKLKKYLEAYGFNVVLTRQEGEILKDDLKTSLQKRVDIANKLKADFFISLHHDKSSNASTTGISAHYSSYRPTIDNEGIVNGKDPGGWSYDDLKIDSTPSVQAKISMELANKLVEGLSTSLGYNNLKAHDHALFVTRQIDVPAVLLESGFLSNANEAEKCADANAQEAKTKKIADIINDYFKNR